MPDLGVIEIFEHLNAESLVRLDADDCTEAVDAPGVHPDLLSPIVLDEPPQPVAEKSGFASCNAGYSSIGA